MPSISIITTTYKHQDFIAQTIESVLSQTYTDRELLIGDDSPDDATWHIIQDYVKKYPDKIKARHHNPNKGIVDNMNFLIQQSCHDTEYIGFLEGDDMYLSTNLEEKIKIFEKYPKLSMVYNNFSTIDTNSKVHIKDGLHNFVTVTRYIQNEQLTSSEFLNGNYYGSYSTLMVRKNILEKYPLRSVPAGTMSYVSDWDMFYRISTTSCIYGIQTSLTLYRIHNNNSSRIGGNIITGLKSIIKLYQQTGEISKDQAKKSFSNFAIGETFDLQLSGNRKKAWKTYVTARKLDKTLSFGKVKALVRFFIPRKIQEYLYRYINNI